MTFLSITASLSLIFFITKYAYKFLRFKIESDSYLMIGLVMTHVIAGLILYPIYPILTFKFWRIKDYIQ